MEPVIFQSSKFKAMIKLTEQELMARAKKLYFDRNKKIKEMYADEFGRFSYNKGNLLEINKGKDIAVLLITKEAVSGVSTKDVPVYDNAEDKKKLKSKKQ